MITNEDAKEAADFLRKKRKLMRIGDAMPGEMRVIHASLEALDRMLPRKSHRDREGNRICPVCRCPLLDRDKFCQDCGQSIKHEI